MTRSPEGIRVELEQERRRLMTRQGRDQPSRYAALRNELLSAHDAQHPRVARTREQRAAIRQEACAAVGKLVDEWLALRKSV